MIEILAVIFLTETIKKTISNHYKKQEKRRLYKYMGWKIQLRKFDSQIKIKRPLGDFTFPWGRRNFVHA